MAKFNLNNLFKKSKPCNGINLTQTCNAYTNSFSNLFSASSFNSEVFNSVRTSVPIIDAALNKLVRLLGSFEVITCDPIAQKPLNTFLKNVKVNSHSSGIDTFIACFFDSMLTYGNAIGEIVLNLEKTDIVALYNSSLKNIQISTTNNPLEPVFLAQHGASFVPVKFPQLILFSALNPKPGQIKGTSILEGLPFITDILLKIYKSIALNFERIGKLKFALNYNPPPNVDIMNAKSIADSIAKEWAGVMNPPSGTTKDLIAIGDPDIKVIGSDNQALDTNTPVRQMLEQIVAKTGIPPFLLGLSWSTSERMSKQQAEILTSEIEGYRRIISPTISKIVNFWLKLNGFSQIHQISWNAIHLHDEVESSRAALLAAQANKINSLI